jgi:hypothetical protein
VKNRSVPGLTFASHFVLTLGILAGGFFSWSFGVPQTIWFNDKSMMTSLIGALLGATIVHLGLHAWKADHGRPHCDAGSAPDIRGSADPSFGHLAERLAVIFGFIGTAIGLSLQAAALAGGAASFTALATSLFTTACGGTAAAIIAVLTFNLEAGIRRSGR